jgi:hypothetical protein
MCPVLLLPSTLFSLTFRFKYRGDLMKAVDVIKSFCGSNASTKVGSCGFSASDLLAALNSDIIFGDTASSAPSTGGRADGVNSAVQVGEAALRSSSSYDFSGRKNGFKSTLKSDKTASVSAASSRRIEYSKDDLDFLAVAFTAVKISYLIGKIVDIRIYTH